VIAIRDSLQVLDPPAGRIATHPLGELVGLRHAMMILPAVLLSIGAQ
jgi:hypothetical protein